MPLTIPQLRELSLQVTEADQKEIKEILDLADRGDVMGEIYIAYARIYLILNGIEINN